jgi:hypothetical protein
LELSEPLRTGRTPAVEAGAIQIEALAPIAHFGGEILFFAPLVHNQPPLPDV